MRTSSYRYCDKFVLRGHSDQKPTCSLQELTACTSASFYMTDMSLLLNPYCPNAVRCKPKQGEMPSVVFAKANSSNGSCHWVILSGYVALLFFRNQFQDWKAHRVILTSSLPQTQCWVQCSQQHTAIWSSSLQSTSLNYVCRQCLCGTVECCLLPPLVISKVTWILNLLVIISNGHLLGILGQYLQLIKCYFKVTGDWTLSN